MQYYDWSEWKSAANEKKHGIRFIDAARVFDDPDALLERDRIVDGEERWQAIGSPNGTKVIHVTHTIEEDGLDETVRLISDRQATQSERRRYEQNREKNHG